MAAAVIRVKRRAVEDPAESIVVNWKRCKLDDSTVSETTRLRLDLVKTVQSKDAAISLEMQNAAGVARDAAISTRPMRGSDLQRTYKRHKLRDRDSARMAKKAREKVNRYKVITSKRPALEETEQGTDFAGGEKRDLADTHTLSSRVSDKQICPSTSYECAGLCTNVASDNSDPVVHDVEVEEDEVPVPSTSQQGSGITLNGKVLESQNVGLGDSGSNNKYVYDLYYLKHDQQWDFRHIENIISIEALHDFQLSESDLLDYSDNEPDENEYEETDLNTEKNPDTEYPEDDSEDEIDGQEKPDGDIILALEENSSEDEFTDYDYGARNYEDSSSFVDPLADEFESHLRLQDYFGDFYESLDEERERYRRKKRTLPFDLHMKMIEHDLDMHVAKGSDRKMGYGEDDDIDGM